MLTKWGKHWIWSCSCSSEKQCIPTSEDLKMMEEFCPFCHSISQQSSSVTTMCGSYGYGISMEKCVVSKFISVAMLWCFYVLMCLCIHVCKRKVLCHHQPSALQEDDLWVVRASPLSCYMRDDWDVTPCPDLFPFTAKGHLSACYFSPSTYSDPTREPVSPHREVFQWPD